MAKAHDREERQMTLAEAASALKVSYFQAHQLMLLGKLEGERHGHRWLVTESSVDRLVDSRNA